MEFMQKILKETRSVTPQTLGEKGRKYRQRVDLTLKEWSGQIEKLRGKARVTEKDLKAKYNREIKNLENKKRFLEKRFGDFKKSNDETWKTVKSRTDTAMTNFKQALDNALSRFKSGR
jgi:hypothetical protein